jgi:hypothetical protein
MSARPHMVAPQFAWFCRSGKEEGTIPPALLFL